ncbi:MAG: DUF3105 domain-containing protein [Rubrobacter sp.]|nr:DUF3105 domain-containing protein [Rubrobacter sp.]
MSTRNSGRGEESEGSRRTYVIIAVVAAVVIGGFITLAVIDSRQRAASTPPSDVQTIDVGDAGQHTEEDVNYEQSPPAGGEHNPTWQNCGYYDEPVRNETAVHSLEHGAVWITYSPDLPNDQINVLRERATNETYLLVSPMEDLPSPVVASAWGKQVQLEDAENEDLDKFIRAFREGPQTPEPGAACTGGVGEPS